MRYDRSDSRDRNDPRRKRRAIAPLERLEGRDLLALAVGFIAATEDVPFGGKVATLATSDITAPLASVSASINWGDGSTATTGTLVADPVGGFDVIGSKTYSRGGQYPVVVTISGTGQTPLTSPGIAFVAPARLIVSGTSFTATAGQSFGGPVASFQDLGGTDPNDFMATINWGAGQATTVGTIAAVAGSPGFFSVSGPYTYTSPGTATASVTVTRASTGQVASAASTATVIAYPFSGSLSTPGDSGPSHLDGITNLNQPTFAGTAAPNAIVRVIGQRSDATQAIPLGETVAGSDGLWTLTAPPLADGRYQISGVIVPTTGSPDPPAILTNILIDTAGPRVVGVTTAPNTDEVTVTIRDDRSGINPAGLLDLDNYALLGPRNSRAQAISVVDLPTVAALPSDPLSVAVTFSLSPDAHRGQYKLRIVSGGITDQAGNGLRGGVFSPVQVSKPRPAPGHKAKATHHH